VNRYNGVLSDSQLKTMRAVTQRMRISGPDAEDVHQETVVRLWLKGKTTEGETAVVARSCAIQHVRDLLGKTGRKIRGATDHMPEQATPDDAMGGAAVRQALRRLTPRQLQLLDDLLQADQRRHIAVRRGVSEAAVSQGAARLMHALQS
jgi:DNA-directed RNA polymerase specialized sigma24 family protein